MKRITGSGLSLLLSAAIGAGITSHLMTSYVVQPTAPTQNVRIIGDTSSPTASPADTVKPSEVAEQRVEGDDGSLGGPVYDENHQTEPTYMYSTPTSENADDDTSSPTPAETKTATPAAQTHEAKPDLPTVSKLPSADDHTPEESPSDTPPAG